MADVLVHLTGVNKREVEAALGRELKPASAAGDQFVIPEEVAQRIGVLPPSPPKAEDSLAAKEAARALPFDFEKGESKVDFDDEKSGEKPDEEVVGDEPAGPHVVARH